MTTRNYVASPAMDASRFHQHAQGSTPLSFTGERVVPDEPGWEWCYQAHRFGYEDLAKRVPPRARLLDIGSGEGYGTSLLSRVAGFTVGCDYSAEAVTHAKKRYGNSSTVFLVCDAQNLPFRSGAFDVVSSLQVIEHFKDTGAHLADVARVLTDEGFHFCATPNIALASPEEAANEWHLRDFSAPELADAMSQAFNHVELLGQHYVEDSARVKAMRAADAASEGTSQRVARIERLLAKMPGPLRVRLRGPLRRLLQVPQIDADAIRNQITAEDFVARPPADSSFCLIAIVKGPRRDLKSAR